MHKDFLREISEKSCEDEAAAIELFQAVMAGLPDDVIRVALVAASELLQEIKNEILEDPGKTPIIKGFSCMFQELANEMQRRSLRRMAG